MLNYSAVFYAHHHPLMHKTHVKNLLTSERLFAQAFLDPKAHHPTEGDNSLTWLIADLTLVVNWCFINKN